MSWSWGLKHRIAHVVHGHEFMTSHHVHMTRHELMLMSDTALEISLVSKKVVAILLNEGEE